MVETGWAGTDCLALRVFFVLSVCSFLSRVIPFRIYFYITGTFCRTANVHLHRSYRGHHFRRCILQYSLILQSGKVGPEQAGLSFYCPDVV